LTVKFVVFVDDRLDHLEDVKVFWAFILRECSTCPGVYNTEFAAFQKQHLLIIEHEVWLDDVRRL